MREKETGASGSMRASDAGVCERETCAAKLRLRQAEYGNNRLAFVKILTNRELRLRGRLSEVRQLHSNVPAPVLGREIAVERVAPDQTCAGPQVDRCLRTSLLFRVDEGLESRPW